MTTKIHSTTISTGLAMFSMFFGAGNVIFPLALGQYAQDKSFFAILGILITAVGVPFLGLLAMTLFDGNYEEFFDRLGKIPGFLLTLFLMILIGPFGGLPRVIVVAFSTSKMFFPNLSLPLFSLVTVLLIYWLTYQRRRILDILGYLLTPILLFSLILIVFKGLFYSPPPLPAEDSALSIFIHSLFEGYNTMDLMGSFFFSSVAILCLKKELHPEKQQDFRHLIKMTLKASCIGAFLLALVYIGFILVAAHNSTLLAGATANQMIGILSFHLLGPYAGLIAILAVSLACLTTAIALAAIFAEFIHEDLTIKKLKYKTSLQITLVICFFVSTLDFQGIMLFLKPIVTFCYPALIVLTIVNIFYKWRHFKPVKIPVLLALLFSLILTLF